ncbi:Zn-finger nucleic acid-binding protein [Allocatelliglobosispora scoriae]|uniref:Zn-finger nucleic acid-binding protein n=1 Tax=Allocatelliglobosispora scoriae TaxID=643052 RepID=A0A841C0P2_9ACTN|nr:zf-TFIIB domain-containing protein [Allocatelliglobosispora scoriae]MBB5872451.1 Zn-finger nucleic acid-binding protein [Allocatelliglobosispora scoriae]
MEMTCPKCHGQMRQYERNGVTVDQCTECRGIFLDRGELEKLVDAENAWHGGSPANAAPVAAAAAQQVPQAPMPPMAPPTTHQQPAYQQPQQQYTYQPQQTHYRDHDSGEYPKYGHGQHGQHGHKKKKSFLDELFD